MSMRGTNEIYINPSILNANLDDLENEIDKISQVSDSIHLDIMDNVFVPNYTFSFDKAVEIMKFSKISVDAHLMVENPDVIAPQYAQSGCDSVTFHFEAVKNCGETIANIKSNDSKVGIAIKPGTPISVIKDYLADIDMLLIMTVEPGFGGQSFMSEQLKKVTEVRAWSLQQKNMKLVIQVDGGISLSTIAQAAAAGANCFVAGSAVYSSSDPADMVTQLRKLATANFHY